MRLVVPLFFWSDHRDRQPCDGDPEVEMAKEVGRRGNRATIEATPVQLETLRSDAAFYCDRDGPGADDPDFRSLRRSAAATLAAIARQT